MPSNVQTSSNQTPGLSHSAANHASEPISVAQNRNPAIHNNESPNSFAAPTMPRATTSSHDHLLDHDEIVHSPADAPQAPRREQAIESEPASPPGESPIRNLQYFEVSSQQQQHQAIPASDLQVVNSSTWEEGREASMYEPQGQNGLQPMPSHYNAGLDPTMDRPTTAASTDTYQQAQTLFRDFDGVHYAPSILQPTVEEDDSRPDSKSSMLREPPPLDNPFPPPASGMVYYPAPVPTTLLLPQRLSKAAPTSIDAKRRSQMIQTLAPDARKSAIWLNERPGSIQAFPPEQEDDLSHLQALKARMSTLPPQLRASMFFENPATLQDVEIKDKSAVATLEDLLDASTTAPVSAFTDHPFAGKAGAAGVYKKEGRAKRQSRMPSGDVQKIQNRQSSHLISEAEDETKRQSSNPIIDTEKPKKRRSSFLGLRRFSVSSTDALNAPDSHLKKKSSRAFSFGGALDDTALNRAPDGTIIGGRSGATTPMLGNDPTGEEDDAEGGEEDDPDFPMPEDGELDYLPPTTLLAELQYRKKIQKTRNRTALESFPNGMHSTLLQMDAVAQVQKKKRQNARITLAWEDPDRVKATENAGGDDEDVPLGMLFAGNSKVTEQLKDQGMGGWDRPMGLLELREREENEPLSLRKARLRGENQFVSRGPSPSMFGAPLLQLNGEEAIESDDEPGESLAQRAQRLKTKKEDGQTNVEGRPISQAFSEELLGQFSASANNSKENLSPGVGDASSNRSASPEGEEETLGQRRARLQRQSQFPQPGPMATGSTAPHNVPQQRPVLRASTSLADLLHHVPVGATRKVSDKDLISGLPANSLLAKSEEVQAAKRERMSRQTSGHMLTQPLMDLGNLNRNSTANAPMNPGFRGGMYNNGGMYNIGFGGQAPATNTASMMDLRQSMYDLNAQRQMQGMSMYGMQQPQMMAYPNAYAGATNSMSPNMGMMGMGMGAGMSMPPVGMMGGMGVPAAYNQMQPMNNFQAASTPNLLSGMNSFAGGSTPNLLGGMGTPQMNAYQQRSSTLMEGRSVAPPMQPAFAEAYLDVKGRNRIDEWRQSVQMG
ncbi:hypothetical protein BT63DRAFT_420309 [Microthyrium microscopicum]|uniref:Uncharacterized protein n=1 Tax=Microthyrium microscopicum TaxID=703497 RepID=A0A6A6US10_9PEZI|nr:hypothetical protein BT63DRAFT_420309 [Microthyrium microscopicum]